MNNRETNALWIWNQNRKKPYTQNQLCELLGISRTCLNAWFNGRMPRTKYGPAIKRLTKNKVSLIDWL